MADFGQDANRDKLKIFVKIIKRAGLFIIDKPQ